jgi:hypothetical protein
LDLKCDKTHIKRHIDPKIECILINLENIAKTVGVNLVDMDDEESKEEEVKIP